MPRPSSGATGLADPQEASHDAQLPAPACSGGGARHRVPFRALQDRALEGWHGRDENVHTGQQAHSHKAGCNSAASLRNIHRRHGDDRVRAWDQRPIAGAPPPPYARGVTPLRSVTAIVLGAALLALVVAAPQAQELLRISGSVQWIAGSRMQVMTTSESPIAVDLTQADQRSEEHTSELQSRLHLVCRLLLEKKKKKKNDIQSEINGLD